ncbi:Hint domain-containing protein [Aquicoccus sp. SU-CL01552]|uniref:Hint domain-containing protein n=1 Tax=Aquicoccus sp. SU-CL01552 TaxID=3127656 RepID=UPI003105E99C
MTIPTSLARAARNAIETSPILKDPAALRARSRPQLRRYEVSALAANGDIVDSRHIAPALPLFENAFSAFTRGSMILTETGPIAVEDLLPGDQIITRDGTSETLMWKGSTQIVPGRPDAKGRYHPLVRIMADGFGVQLPMSDVLVGPAARLLKTPGHLRKLVGQSPLLTPVAEFIDGVSAIETAPPTAVQLFHICLRRHSVIRIGGLEFETYHPGINALRPVGPALRDAYLKLFPHISSAGDFGPQVHARAGDGEINALSA